MKNFASILWDETKLVFESLTDTISNGLITSGLKVFFWFALIGAIIVGHQGAGIVEIIKVFAFICISPICCCILALLFMSPLLIMWFSLQEIVSQLFGS